jgi:hypothetical protein
LADGDHGANADGPVSLHVKYFNRGQVGAFLPGKKSSSFLFAVLVDHCTAQIHIKGTVTITRER